MALGVDDLPINSVLLETGRPDSENLKSYLFTEPSEIVEAWAAGEVEDALAAVDHWISRGCFAAGFLSYEAGFAFEALGDPSDCRLPLVWFGIYETRRAFDETLLARPDQPKLSVDPEFSPSRSDYECAFRSVKHHLREGDVYQINLTGAFEFAFDGGSVELYRELRDRQSVGYNALIRTHHGDVVSCSPELFFRRDGDQIVTRPMKGTVRRGRNEAEDRVLSEWLRHDDKTRAENLMIVDLLRNDLSRIAEFGSVEVPDLFVPELYETVIQLTSTVQARLKPDVTYLDIFRAMFPCGSVTGAPKVRAMELIRDIESRSRGLYTGAIGFIDPDDSAVFSVAIRTATLSNGVGRLGSGGGVVWDSEVGSEYREALVKGLFLTGGETEPGLIETMVWDRGFDRYEYHLARIESSAAELGYPFDRRRFDQALERALEGCTSQPIRVRVVLESDGNWSTRASSLAGPSLSSGPIRVSDVRMRSGDRFLRHKTTRREVYDAEYAEGLRMGFVETIFLNERDELTEGSRSNLFVRRHGRLQTPPISCGVLPGTRRAEILETCSDVEQRVLRMEDLALADEILLCNATSPLTPVQLLEEHAV